jgi:hypothetical protein
MRLWLPVFSLVIIFQVFFITRTIDSIFFFVVSPEMLKQEYSFVGAWKVSLVYGKCHSITDNSSTQ